MDIERTMQFILEQQARHEEYHREMEQTILQLGQTMLNVASAQERTSQILDTLAQRQVDTEQALQRLTERQAAIQEHLNVLLLTVERHLSNHK